MRAVKNIEAEENARVVDISPGWMTLRYDPIEPEPVGTIVLKAFRIAGYDKDCDGSLMARMENLALYGDGKIDASGWDVTNIGLYHDGLDFVVTEEELLEMYEQVHGGDK